MNARWHAPPAAEAEGWAAALDLGFAHRAGRTVLARNAHHGPLRVQKALYPEGEAVCQVLVLHPPSGIAGGDRLDIRIEAAAGSTAQLTTPGAGKWYRSAGRPAAQSVAISVAAGAALEWLPQETIVFDGAIGRLDTRIELAADAAFIGWEILCLGRHAAGERFRHGRLDLDLSIDRAGRPLWRERGGFDGGDPLLDSPVGWAGASVCATLLACAPGLAGQAAALLAACRALAPADGAAHGLTLLPNEGGLLVARYLGDSSEAARHWLAALWHEIRPACLGRAALPPRIWNT